ncbi:transposase [Rhizobium ruizarguesonis]|uniref:transposase n=1 Tax=Rhizobium TaxID=379 RepID=UPI0010309918|nr:MULTISPECIES: transposase [Rhizobium]TAZ62449.1 transposase [Rhizobium leguminosarum]TBC85426.1 transposase [Rhizobium ruizarguesonis]
MTDEHEEELAMIAARAAEIKAGLDAAYSVEELRRPLSTRSVHALIASSTAGTALKLKMLSARIAILEEAGVKYAGIFQRAASYARGDTVTHAGSLWVALKTVPVGTAPGSDPACWQLASKGGKPVKRTPAGSIST